MKTESELEFSYDQKSDVLYAFVGKRKPTKNIEKGNGITLRLDPETEEPLGFIIIDFKKRLNNGLLGFIPSFQNIQLPSY